VFRGLPDAGVERWAGREPDVPEPGAPPSAGLNPRAGALRAWLPAAAALVLGAPCKPGAVLSAARSFAAPVFADEARPEAPGAARMSAEPEPEVAAQKPPAAEPGRRAAPGAAAEREPGALPLPAKSKPARAERAQASAKPRAEERPGPAARWAHSGRSAREPEACWPAQPAWLPAAGEPEACWPGQRVLLPAREAEPGGPEELAAPAARRTPAASRELLSARRRV